MTGGLPVNYEELLSEVAAIVSSEPAPVDKLASVCELLRERVAHYDWVGFYLVDPVQPRELVLGPYSGAHTDHSHIPFGRGVCGQAAEREETLVVRDVAAETNYLSCNPDVKSEIVLPIMRDGVFAGELDIDSHEPASFTDADRSFLESVCELVSGIL